MNVLFLSPGYPPSFVQFVTALRARGASVLGVGDLPTGALRPELRAALSDYVHVGDLGHYDAVHRAVALLIHRHGRIDHVDSLNEFWLPLEARLREDFNVPGVRPEATRRFQSKRSMAEVFAAAALDPPATTFVRAWDDVRRFASKHGFPLLLKPDVGVGAEAAFKLRDEAALDAMAASGAQVAGFVVQPFVEGEIVSFDGLCDRDGRILFESALVYCGGVLETVTEKRDVWMYTRREIPEALRTAGTGMVKAFDTRARFFHCELFHRPDGSFVPLEINLRPPGGFGIDLMNYTCDIDVAGLWAAVVTQGDFSDFRYERRWHAAHVGRRDRAYAEDVGSVVSALGARLVALPDVPSGIGDAMGKPIFLVRDPEEAVLRGLIARLLRPA